MNAQIDGKTFVDTNIFVYAFDNSANQKHHIAKEWISRLFDAGLGSLSIQVLQEFYIIVTRKIVNPLGLVEARQIVADLAQWTLHVPDQWDLLRAIDLQVKCQISFWDANIIQSATSLGCNILLSEDLNHQQMYGQVMVINPFL